MDNRRKTRLDFAQCERFLKMAMVAVFFIGMCAPATAQLGFYAMGSGTRVSGTNVGASTPAGSSGNFTAYGGTIGIYNMWAHLGPISLGSDYRFTFGTSSNSTSYGNNVRDGFISLRGVFKVPVVALRPYVQAGFGAATTNYGRYDSDSGSGSIAYEFEGGVDFAVAPHVDLRAEYGVGELVDSASQVGTASLQLQQFGVGVVGRF